MHGGATRRCANELKGVDPVRRLRVGHAPRSGMPLQSVTWPVSDLSGEGEEPLMRNLHALLGMLLAGSCGGGDNTFSHERATQRAHSEMSTQTYEQAHGSSACATDCSGHQAGYRWAHEHEIDDASLCPSRSPAFNEGCRAYAEDVAGPQD